MVAKNKWLYRSHEERCEAMTQYLIEHRSTVRQVALVFSVSKSTVHKDIATRLKYINPQMYTAAKDILEQNKSERHLRGGEATKQKYLHAKAETTMH